MKSFNDKLALLALFCLLQWVPASYGLTEESKEPVRFNITLTWEEREVAGLSRKVILSNGQFPAPQLRLRQGDNVEFVMNNQMPFSTTIHLHGIEQTGTPWSDGVPGLSQFPTASGEQFVYRWKATQYGTYYYHSHRRGQIDDGLYGAIYIQPDDSVERPFNKITDDKSDLALIRKAERNTQPVVLSDWHVLTSEEVWEGEKASGLDAICANAILINGKGSIHCLAKEFLKAAEKNAMKNSLGDGLVSDIGCLLSVQTAGDFFRHNVSTAPNSIFKGCTPSEGETETIKVDPEAQWVSFDLINASGVSTPLFSIDEHPIWVYAVDGRYIEPMKAHAISITTGARYSVLVKLDQPAGDYTIRAPNHGTNQILNGIAMMSYPHSKAQTRPSKPFFDIFGSKNSVDAIILDENKVVPFPSISPSQDVDRTYKLIIDHYHLHTYRWTLGNTTFDMAYEESTPMLFNRTSIPTDLTISTHNGTWVDIVIEVHPPIQPPHPIHKHSNKYFVIGQGKGLFEYSSVAEAMKVIPESFNLRTPQIRDTFTTPEALVVPSWLALRYQVVNPGPFLIHCHVQVHLSGGMALALLDGVDKWPTVPDGYRLPAVEN